MWSQGNPLADELIKREDFDLKVEMPDQASLAREIRFNMAYFQANRLLQSTKWLGELLVTVSDQSNYQVNNATFNDDQCEMMTDSKSQQPSNLKFTDQVDFDSTYQYSTRQPFTKVFYELPNEVTDTLNLARALFDLREYRKCAHMLKRFANPRYQSALFLHNYALFQVSELTKEEEILQSGDKISCSNVENKELTAIEVEMQQYYERGQLNGINLYLYGVVLREKNKKEEAKKVFIEALNKNPLLWSAWLELGQLINQSDRDVLEMELREHWMKNFYYASFCLEIQQERDCVRFNGGLLKHFPNSVYLVNQIAHASYTSQEYDIALDWFQKLIESDPYRYENMDLYSNILYIKENFGELAHLAYKVFHNDKYRPESCCVIGNYYSLRGDHHKAVIYFKRAIKLDNKFLSAWTLMGHEYLEMKNTNAAIESYRTAVDIDPKDFRAWYGLGQTYEINQMYNYASHYYANAALSKPQDSRMWNAIGNCYEKMDRKEEAVKCHERAERCKDKEGIALHKLAKLYIAMNENQKAAICYTENLKRKEQEQCVSQEINDALMFLAKFYKQQGRLEEAMHYAKKLKDYSGTERDQASKLISQIEEIDQFQQHANNR